MNPLAAALTTLCLGACATIPAAVLKPVSAAISRGEEGTGRAVDPASLISQVSIARPNDGWFVDYQKASPTAWCGTGGCSHELYVARGGGLRNRILSATRLPIPPHPHIHSHSHSVLVFSKLHGEIGRLYRVNVYAIYAPLRGWTAQQQTFQTAALSRGRVKTC